MTWGHPLVLWLLAALPVLAALRWAWGRRLRLRQVGLGVGVPALARGASRRRAALRQALLWSGLAAAIIALAGPRWGQTHEKRVARGGDLLIALDCSRSMLATDVFPDRTRRARDKALDLVRSLPDLRVALLPFAAAPVLRCPLTSDHQAIATMLEDCTPELFPASDGWQGSAIGSAVERGVEVLGHDTGRSQAILVVSDGGDPDHAAVERATARAQERGIRVYGLFIGDPSRAASITIDGKPVTVTGERDTLDRIAAASGAISVNAGTDDGDVRALAAHLDRSNAGSPLEERMRLVHSERYQWPAGAALLLLAAGWLTPTARRRVAAALLVLVTVAPAAEPWAELADALAASQGDAARATARLTAVVEAHPGFAAARYDLGTLLMESDPVAAERHLAQAASDAQGPLAAASAHNLGLVRLRLGRWEDALAAATRAAGLAPNDEDLRRTRDAIADAWRQRQAALAARAKALPPRPRLVAPVLPAVRVGAAVDLPLAVADGSEATLLAGAGLPDGMRLTDGRLLGTPTQAGRWDLGVVLSGGDGRPHPARARLWVLPAARIETARLPIAVVGAAWHAPVTVAGLDLPHWQVDGLPPGLGLRPDGGGVALTGTPAVAGSATITLRARDGVTATTRTLPVTIADGPVAGEAELPPATVGAPYRTRLTLRGDARRRRWREVDLPSGLALAADGTLSGTPTTAGDHQLDATADADDGSSVLVRVVLPVRPAPAIAADDPVRLRRARLADHALRAEGGCGPVRWSGSDGPPGVRLDEDGVLRGVPTAVGETILLATATDSWGARGERRVRIVVEEAEPPREKTEAKTPEPPSDQPQPKPDEPSSKPGDQPEDPSTPPAQDPSAKPPQPGPKPGEPKNDGGEKPDEQPPEPPSKTAAAPGAPTPEPPARPEDGPVTGSEAPRPATAPADPEAEAAERWLEQLPTEPRAVLREQLLRSAPPPDRGGQPW